MAASKKKRKVAVVMSGGGMQCAYGAGALIALAEEYGLTEPDFLFAPSGAATSAAYYLAGQYEKVSVMWMSFASDPKFISLTSRPIVNIDYLVDLLKKEIPLDLRKLKKNKSNLLFPVARARDSKLVYLHAKRTREIYTQIHATLAAPYIYGKKVNIRGVQYMDGFFGYSIHEYMQHAVKLGATDIIVLSSSAHEYRGVTKAFLKSVSTYGSYVGVDPAVVAVTKRAMQPDIDFTPPSGVRVALVVPPKRMPLSVLGGSKFNYRKVFNDGYEAAVKSAEVRKLLSGGVV